ncbi:uncharacterized protein LOC124356191 [Homalodisca vitripennis]|uniref:uncharacterized protein LOC124356191 n=1 Tax=Homalodisca vitripennis TaxID=197043 RepID=UPI001EEB6D7F|nr:uncharacterized protein LOC124356191 [Homalodisca vitripennis]
MAVLWSFTTFATLAIYFTAHFALAAPPPKAPNPLLPDFNWGPMGFCAYGNNALCGPSDKAGFFKNQQGGFWVYCCPGYYCYPDDKTVKRNHMGPDFHCVPSGTQKEIAKPTRPTRPTRRPRN